MHRICGRTNLADRQEIRTVNQPYRLTSGAESDTKQILRYTLEHWGLEQAARYAAQLEGCLEKIVSKQASGRLFSKRFTDVLVCFGEGAETSTRGRARSPETPCILTESVRYRRALRDSQGGVNIAEKTTCSDIRLIAGFQHANRNPIFSRQIRFSLSERADAYPAST